MNRAPGWWTADTWGSARDPFAFTRDLFSGFPPVSVKPPYAVQARSSVRSFGNSVNPRKSTVPGGAGVARFFRRRHAASSTDEAITIVTESRYGRPAQKRVFAWSRFVFPVAGAN